MSDDNTILVCGWLQKRSKSHSWQRKWFVLRKHQLAYYKNQKEYKASKVLPSAEILSATQVQDDHSSSHFIIVTSSRVFHLRAQSDKELAQWLEMLGGIVAKNSSMDAVSLRRMSAEQLREIDVQEDDDDDEEDDPEAFIPPPQTLGKLHTDMENLHLSGTDDNFTSAGASDSGTTPTTSNFINSMENNSTVSLNHFKERPQPTPIPEEAEPFPDDDTPVLTAGETTVEPRQQRTVYFNSFSSSSPEHIIDKGYLYRLKKRYNQWKKYYITLTNHYLYFYKNSRDFTQGKEYKRIDLDGIIDCVELDPLSRSRVFCMLIVTPKKRLRFCADSEEELTKWLVLLKTIVKTRKNEREGAHTA